MPNVNEYIEKTTKNAAEEIKQMSQDSQNTF
mgnify:CR=1 FL=1